MANGIITLLDQPRTLAATGLPTTATIYFYETGTTNLATIYSDVALTTTATNPVVLAAGEMFPDIYLDPAEQYRRRIEYGDGSIHDVDPLLINRSTSLDFQRNATGSVIRTVQDKLEDEVFVEDFGAVGDGSTDDTVAIQAAMDATSGELNFREGKTYIAEGLVPHDDLTLNGNGCIIRPPVTPSNHLIYYNSGNVLYNFNIKNVIFQGRGTTTWDCIHINDPVSPTTDQTWNESTLDKLEITNFRYGIWCPTPRSVRIRDCHIHINKYGVVWDMEHFYLTHSFISYNEIGLYVGHASPVSTGIHHFRIIGCAIAHNTVAGMKGNMSAGSITATSFIDNGSTTSDGHIVSEGLLTNMRIMGNRFEKGVATPYAINITTDTASRNVIVGNTFISNATSDLYGSFAQCTIVGNLSRKSGGHFFRNTGSSSNDNIISNNTISEPDKEAIFLTGSQIATKVYNNSIMDAGFSLAGTYNAIHVDTGATLVQCAFVGNSARNTTGTLYTNYGLSLSNATTLTNIVVKDNIFRNLAQAISVDTTSTSITGGNVKMENNHNAVTENKGSATVLSGNTSVTVTHGLGYTPGASSIMVTANSDLAGASFYVLNVTATTFDIGMSSAPAANKSFSWRAKMNA